ncbi:interleukin-8-like isoform X2 [Scyliorhinus canicula]|uniref:interleukin-8-like isoform X2 n=1 Tax=Scyliorhinus canicula TaxID=7830 RepID=UPI0018F6DECD|nr:interleukin-8-like isoform X2 [Scyliorhinus canicula]
MRIHARFLLLGTIVICLAAHGFCIGTITNSRCKCVNVISNFIHPRRYQHVGVFNQGSFCRKVEIVITLKHGKRVCVNPKTQWVKRMVSFLAGPNEVVTESSTE